MIVKDRFRVKGPLVGTCAICGQRDRLTEDHVPPKGATRITPIELRELTDRLSLEPPRKKSEFSQNGVKFRSICATCNNVRLGAECDPDLIKLCAAGKALLQTPIYIPDQAVSIRPARALRAIVGHMLATGSGAPAGPWEQSMAAYFLDTGAPLPRQINCFYWPYPWPDQVIVRFATIGFPGTGRPPLSFKLLKFFPYAFMLTWEKPDVYQIPFPDLARYGAFDRNRYASVPVPIAQGTIPHQRWPEAPTEDAMILYSGSSVHAEPRKNT